MSQCHLLICVISLFFMSIRAEYWEVPILRADNRLLGQYEVIPLQPERVKLQLYYESLCPDCRVFDGLHFAPTVRKLGDNLDVHLYPYGNARTIVQPGGKVEIICQHGPAECYGNMLHACAIDYLNNITKAVFFNACMMDFSQNNKGSDDEAAEKCGRNMNVDYEPIKLCAKSSRGFTLLKYYGDETKKVSFNGVPYVLINGVPNSGETFMHDVCAAFKNPPRECTEYLYK